MISDVVKVIGAGSAKRDIGSISIPPSCIVYGSIVRSRTGRAASVIARRRRPQGFNLDISDLPSAGKGSCASAVPDDYVIPIPRSE